MRNCEKLISKLKNKEEEFAYIKELIKDKELFFAFRENYINVYYMGGNLAKIGFNKSKEVYFELHKKYVQPNEDKYPKTGGNNYVRLSWRQHKEEMRNIRANIKRIAEGFKEDGSKGRKSSREKICQQWIINNTNTKNGDWYYVDMEYIQKGNPLGRFDMIAIKRTKDENKKHKVALIELKVGTKSYGSMDGTRYSKNEEKKIKYDNIKAGSLYDYNKRENYISYGSGLLGHLCDYMRYLSTEAYNEFLKQEIVNQIKALKELGGVLDERVGEIADINMLSDKPEVYFLSFSKVPGLKERNVSKKKMRDTFYKYLYADDETIARKYRIENCSEYSAESMLNEKEIKGLLDIKSEFLQIDNPSFELEIGKTKGKYRFNCVFVDADKEGKKEYLF